MSLFMYMYRYVDFVKLQLLIPQCLVFSLESKISPFKATTTALECIAPATTVYYCISLQLHMVRNWQGEGFSCCVNLVLLKYTVPVVAGVIKLSLL